MSNSLIISSYGKNDLYKLACKTSSVIDLTNYKKYKNLYTKLIREAKKNIIIQKSLTAKGTCKENYTIIFSIFDNPTL
jgi:hypothetical protein